MRGARDGFWCRHGKHGLREAVDWAAAFAGFAACAPEAGPDGEHYLSYFTFGPEFRRHLAENRSTAGYDGTCGADFLWWAIDRADDIDAALADARALCIHLTEQWRVPDAALMVFLSGSKGFHIGIPTALWCPQASVCFNRVAKRFAIALAAQAGGSGVAFDLGTFDKVRLFRAPNSVHPRTRLRKRRFPLDDFLHLGIDQIVALARQPVEFEVPSPRGVVEPLATAWVEAARAVAEDDRAMQQRAEEVRGSGGRTRLNALTMDFIRDGADVGGSGTAPDAGRHDRLFAAAADLAEFGCPAPLAHALLTETALGCGIRPGEVTRHINNGLARGARKAAGGG